ncbi:hypothetical protein [Paracoccus sp. (in: a-proteobacteria)]|uniref:hypothetical protein n=1 Tax=Paracoccus sp. TaxID=267 RepID=UPI00322029DB
MPQLVRLYLFSTVIGLALGLVFTALLLVLDVAGLWHLVSATRGGWIAVFMLAFFHAVLFSGVQFAIRIMLMAQRDTPAGGKRQRIRLHLSARAEAAARRR